MSRGARSHEERERARLQREAKRAKREGRPPPVAPPPTEVPPPDLAGGVMPAEPAPASRMAARAPEVAQAPPPEAAPPSDPAAAEPRDRAEPPAPQPPPAPRAEPPAPQPPPAASPAPAPDHPAANAPVEPEEEGPVELEPENAAVELEPENAAVEPEEEGPVEPEEGDAVELEGESAAVEPVEENAAAEGGQEPAFDEVEEAGFEDDEPWREPLVYPEDLDEHDEPGARAPAAPPPFSESAAPARTAPRPLPAFPGADGGGPGRKRSRGAGHAVGARPRRWGRLVAAVLVVLIVLALGWLLVSLYQPFKGDGEGSVAVTIPLGTDVAGIASLLERRGVVADAFLFRARATLSGRAGNFKAGDFELRRDMSYAAAMDALTDSPDADTVTVTVPEGRARTEVKEIVAGTLGGDYVAASRRSPLLDPGRYRAGSVRDLEGFLFPATYELDRGSTARDLVREQLKAFKAQFEKVDLSFARRKNLTPYDVLVIASMVDREAQLARERPLVASVIYNRLSEGIPLGIDATIRFATKNWTEPLTESELSIESPYNTRTRQGLPPGPIGSPGLAALRAAARPRRSAFLFYVVKPGTCGEHAFSKTDAQFQRDVERYNDERAERGGKSPTDC